MAEVRQHWKIPAPDRKLLEQLMAKSHFPETILSILVSRGIDTYDKLLQYTHPSVLDLNSPFYFRDMEKAIDRIEKALTNGEGILIFGDRDVDGVTATTILYKYLQRQGANIVYRVPEGVESYGISKETVSWAAMNEFSLLITVDCGITSVEEAEYATSLGLDIIITDHHEAREILPKALAIINPKVKDSGYPFLSLSGSSVAFKLVCGMMEKSALGEHFNQEIVFFDIETTGLNYGRDEIIEIGAVKVKNGVVIAEMQALIKPSCRISAEITQITHITNEMLDKEGVTIEEALKQFETFIGSCKIVGHNAIEFDMKFIQQAFKKAFDKTLANPVEDTLKMARVMLKKISDHKLLTVGQSLGIYVDAATLHRSLSDSHFCAEVYRRLILQRNSKIVELYNEFLPLAAIGTIADIMPLVDENRNIVKNGLKLIPHSVIGLIYLIRSTNLNMERLTSREISWNIAPLLNSPGRIGNASFSVELLISNKIKEAEELVQEILAKDTTRKEIVDDGAEIANKLVNEETVRKEKAIFIASAEFTRGTTGLLANRLSSQYQIPAVVVSIDGSTASGSVRALSGFNVVRMLESMSGIFVQFGGHKAAGGFVLAADDVPKFKEAVVKYMESFNSEELMEEITIDAVLEGFEELSLSTIRYLENILEPTGNRNEIPKILIRRVKIISCREIGKTGGHSLMTAQKNGKEITVIGWNWASKLQTFIKKGPAEVFYDIVGSPEINKYQGVEEVRLNLVDIRESCN